MNNEKMNIKSNNISFIVTTDEEYVEKLAIIEHQLAWVVYVVGSVISGRAPSISFFFIYIFFVIVNLQSIIHKYGGRNGCTTGYSIMHYCI
jgi:hypothetical protein